MTPEAVRAAADRISAYAHVTPVLTSRTLDALAGATLLLKAEHQQRTGSFKFRGAMNALLQSEGAVVAYSSGNHAQAIAAAAGILGRPATIVMPADAPALKLAAVRGYGAEVVTYDRATGDRAAIAQELAERTGGVLVPPFDHPDVIAGQGTVGLELADLDLDVLVVPTSGGGLAAGCATALPDVRIVLAEPAAGDDFAQSLTAGHRVRLPQPQTIADGLAVQTPGELTFPILQARGAEAVTVTDDELRATMRLVFERLKQVLEPSGAAALAVVLKGGYSGRVGVVLSGGNVGAEAFTSLLGLPRTS